jgi:hypothetical protein
MNIQTIKFQPHEVRELGFYQITTKRAEWSRVEVVNVSDKTILLHWQSWVEGHRGRKELKSFSQSVQKAEIIEARKFRG